MNCRSCARALTRTILDLGFAPPSNAFLRKEQLSAPEKTFPLRVMLCESCWLVQTEDFLERNEVFDSDYHYLSSTSISWVDHSKSFTEEIISDLGLDSKSFVVEVASNDGYLLQHFQSFGIPCLGVEPTTSTARVAREKGITTIVDFFGEELSRRLQSDYGSASLIVGNNVFAHVPDLNDFCAGIERLLLPDGVCTLEFPHLLNLLELNQFDTIYHEHFSYLSLLAISPLLDRHNLRIFKVKGLQTHGGSLRVYITKKESKWKKDDSVDLFLAQEIEFGLDTIFAYKELSTRARQMKIDLLKFLIEARDQGKIVAGYGAAAKGNTFLNFAGIDRDLIEFVVDAAPSKQSKFLPGSHIPVYAPDTLLTTKPDIILILPWNIADEVIEQNRELLDFGCDFYVAVPSLRKLN